MWAQQSAILAFINDQQLKQQRTDKTPLKVDIKSDASGVENKGVLPRSTTHWLKELGHACRLESENMFRIWTAPLVIQECPSSVRLE